MGIKVQIIKHYFRVYRRGTSNFSNSIVVTYFSLSQKIWKKELLSFKCCQSNLSSE